MCGKTLRVDLLLLLLQPYGIFLDGFKKPFAERAVLLGT